MFHLQKCTELHGWKYFLVSCCFKATIRYILPYALYCLLSDQEDQILVDVYATFLRVYLSHHYSCNTVEEVVPVPLGTGVNQRHQGVCYFHMRGSVLEGSSEAYCNRTL